MKTTFLKPFVGVFIILAGCHTDDPGREDTPELITKATLTFTPTGGTPIVTTATDPDGEGVQEIAVDGAINLMTNTAYSLKIELINGLYASTEEGYLVSKEIEKESDEHQFYFEWSDGAFSNPPGNGNVDNRDDPINYLDKDDNNLPLGLMTSWTTGSPASSKTFRVLLKHQPGLKSTTSSSTDGESDLDISFTLNVN